MTRIINNVADPVSQAHDITDDSPVSRWVQEAVYLFILGGNASQHEIEDVEILLSLILMNHTGFLQEVLIDFGPFDYRDTKIGVNVQS